MWNRLIPWGLFAWALSKGRDQWEHHHPFFVRRRPGMLSVLISCLIFAGLGAGLMYLLDPAGGRRRRAVLRDKVTSAAHAAGEVVAKKSKHLKNVAQGVAHEASAKVRQMAGRDEEISTPS